MWWFGRNSKFHELRPENSLQFGPANYLAARQVNREVNLFFVLGQLLFFFGVIFVLCAIVFLCGAAKLLKIAVLEVAPVH